MSHMSTPTHICVAIDLFPHASLLSCWLLLLVPGCRQGGGARDSRLPPMPVEVEPTIGPSRVSDRFEGVGSIEALEAITVVAEIDGAVKALPFIEGYGVMRRGELIAQLDDGQLRC